MLKKVLQISEICVSYATTHASITKHKTLNTTTHIFCKVHHSSKNILSGLFDEGLTKLLHISYFAIVATLLTEHNPYFAIVTTILNKTTSNLMNIYTLT